MFSSRLCLYSFRKNKKYKKTKDGFHFSLPLLRPTFLSLFPLKIKHKFFFVGQKRLIKRTYMFLIAGALTRLLAHSLFDPLSYYTLRTPFPLFSRLGAFFCRTFLSLWGYTKFGQKTSLVKEAWFWRKSTHCLVLKGRRKLGVHHSIFSRTLWPPTWLLLPPGFSFLDDTLFFRPFGLLLK